MEGEGGRGGDGGRGREGGRREGGAGGRGREKWLPLYEELLQGGETMVMLHVQVYSDLQSCSSGPTLASLLSNGAAVITSSDSQPVGDVTSL